VVITGASSGVGESTARLLAGNGAKVVLGARRKDRIDAVVKDITTKGGSALGFKTDVTKRGDVEALVKGAIDKHGRIDAIVRIMPIAPNGAPGKQLGGSDQKESARVIQNGYSGRLDRARSLTPWSNQPRWKSTRSSSGPRRRISNVERRERTEPLVTSKWFL